MKYDDVLERTVFGRGGRLEGSAMPMNSMNDQAKVRHLVANWTDDAPRGAVSAFCTEHQVSRSWFYKVRAVSLAQGPGKAMERASTRPVNSPRKTSQTMERLLLDARASLKKTGANFGPLSVMAMLERQGLKPPSRATVCRIFSRAGVVSTGTTKAQEHRGKHFSTDEARQNGDSLRPGDGAATMANMAPFEEQTRRPAMAVSDGEWHVPALRGVRPGETRDAFVAEKAPTPAKPLLRAIEAASRRVDNNGTVTVLGTHFQVGKNRIGQNVTVLRNETTIMFFDHRGTEIVNYPIPSKGTRYVGNSNPAQIYG